jgi:hypothetical protein
MHLVATQFTSMNQYLKRMKSFENRILAVTSVCCGIASAYVPIKGAPRFGLDFLDLCSPLHMPCEHKPLSFPSSGAPSNHLKSDTAHRTSFNKLQHLIGVVKVHQRKMRYDVPPPRAAVVDVVLFTRPTTPTYARPAEASTTSVQSSKAAFLKIEVSHRLQRQFDLALDAFSCLSAAKHLYL